MVSEYPAGFPMARKRVATPQRVVSGGAGIIGIVISLSWNEQSGEVGRRVTEPVSFVLGSLLTYAGWKYRSGAITAFGLGFLGGAALDAYAHQGGQTLSETKP